MSSGDGEAPSGCGSPTARRVRRPLPCGVYAAFFFDPAGRPGPRRRLRRRRPVFGFGDTGAAFFCAIFSATAFGGRPGPPGRHFPRVLRRRRRRPFFALGFVPEALPSNERMASPTSSCTKSRITVAKLFCLGMTASLPQKRILDSGRESKGRGRRDCAARRSAVYRAIPEREVPGPCPPERGLAYCLSSWPRTAPCPY